jgi:hypothetical protein
MTEKEIIDLFNKRGFINMNSTLKDDEVIKLSFCKRDLNDPIRYNIDVNCKDNECKLYTVINPGMIEISSPAFSQFEDDERFNMFTRIFVNVLHKVLFN